MCVKRWCQVLVSWAMLEVLSQKRQQHLFTMIQFSHDLITVTLPGVINLLQQDIDRLLRLKNRSAWIITHCSRSSEAIEQLQWLTLSSRHSYHKVIVNSFLCLHSLVPSYFSLYFTRFSDIHNYSTRRSMRLSLPKVEQNFGKRTVRFTGRKIFNKLPLIFWRVKTFRHSAAKQDISFYPNFDILFYYCIFIRLFKCNSLWKFLMYNNFSRYKAPMETSLRAEWATLFK